MRPSDRELWKKIADALAALRAGRWDPGLTKHVVADLAELELDASRDLPVLLIQLLEEIQTAGPSKCYRGTRPPQKSYEPEIEKLELWAFAWHSERFGKRMYLKFALRKQCYVYVDCHKDR